MPYANIAEVSTCLSDCIDYCQKHQDIDYCEHHLPHMLDVKNEMKEAWATTDKHFARWKREAGEDKLSWKNLAKLLREVQRKLERIDAIGYPDRRVMYWDEAILENAAREMMDYLAEHTGNIDFAEDYLTRMEQLIDTAHGEHDQSEDALRSYRRFFRQRRDALSNAYHVIGEFRESMRRNLGKDHPDYQSIRWAWSVSPDETVL
ncbi:hypothetical protein FIV42_28175 [Persicimonas caeni]|uniref:Uncharacterized protein n=1 Tax=Persicimonas caeni TaxID=2292766 RepID=A0A4Y6Q1S4_PERCE|nr:hypothetical protein [Persicimonas caeni]QDG54482.1 hypothetical protein FIV42_28175 [Persicimonas caeni]QED35703.1 hypothetical protein FRD00_28170 [Persicimonas caeni]